MAPGTRKFPLPACCGEGAGSDAPSGALRCSDAGIPLYPTTRRTRPAIPQCCRGFSPGLPRSRRHSSNLIASRPGVSRLVPDAPLSPSGAMRERIRKPRSRGVFAAAGLVPLPRAGRLHPRPVALAAVERRSGQAVGVGPRLERELFDLLVAGRTVVAAATGAGTRPDHAVLRRVHRTRPEAARITIVHERYEYLLFYEPADTTHP